MAVSKLMQMTGSKFLLDTNIISALLKGDIIVADKMDDADGVYIPVIALGELYYGASYSTHTKKNITNIQKLISKYDVLLIDQVTASISGSVKAALRKKGKPIPENDVWISAIAKRYDLIIATRDKHFQEIEGLAIQRW
jgi:tRNA(fMet)-specific endonuclease VapC